MAGKPAFECPLDIFGHGVSGQGDDGNGDLAVHIFPGANQDGRLIPVHYGHLDVHEDQVVPLGLNLGDGPLAVHGDVQLVGSGLEITLDEEAVIRAVFHQQNF